MEVPSGFEPLNNGFADRPLGPLGHGTPMESRVYPEEPFLRSNPEGPRNLLRSGAPEFIPVDAYQLENSNNPTAERFLLDIPQLPSVGYCGSRATRAPYLGRGCFISNLAQQLTFRRNLTSP